MPCCFRLSGLKRVSVQSDAGARRPGNCLQSSFKRVRLPPASFDRSTAGSDYISTDANVRTTTSSAVSEMHPNCQSGLHQHPVTVCRKARCLGNHLVGPFYHNKRSNCLQGIHDGPKVAMPGDRLVNGAGVSLRQWGQSTVHHTAWRIRTAVAAMQFSAHLRWIAFLNGIAAIRPCSGNAALRRFWDDNLKQKKGSAAGLEYMHL